MIFGLIVFLATIVVAISALLLDRYQTRRYWRSVHKWCDEQEEILNRWYDEACKGLEND